MINLTEETFATAVEGAGAPVIVDFWSPGCGPCRMLEPVLRQVAAEHDGRLVAAKVDISAEGALAERFKVKATPTFIVFRDGAEVARKTGAIPASVLRTMAAEAAGA